MALPCGGAMGHMGLFLTPVCLKHILATCLRTFSIGSILRKNSRERLILILKSVAFSIIICWKCAKQPMSERTYHCPCCFLVIDRDLNASYNILGLGLQSRVIPEAPGAGARGVVKTDQR